MDGTYALRFARALVRYLRALPPMPDAWQHDFQGKSGPGQRGKSLWCSRCDVEWDLAEQAPPGPCFAKRPAGHKFEHRSGSPSLWCRCSAEWRPEEHVPPPGPCPATLTAEPVRERRIAALELALRDLAMQHNELGRESRGFAAQANALTAELAARDARMAAWSRVMRMAVEWRAVSSTGRTELGAVVRLIAAVDELGEHWP